MHAGRSMNLRSIAPVKLQPPLVSPGLGPAAALLLGAVLAPIDPVLAPDVQVRLNDGLAFPFVNLAIAIALHGAAWDHGR